MRTLTYLKYHLCDIVEIVLAILFLQGGVKIVFAKPLLVDGIISYLTNQTAIYAYAGLCLFLGFALLAAKFWHRKRLHKYSLLGMFLVATYVFILSVYLTGFHPGMLLTIVIIAASGGLWLRWKLKTEYINPKQFEEYLEN